MYLDIVYIYVHKKIYVYRKPERIILIWDGGSIYMHGDIFVKIQNPCTCSLKKKRIMCTVIITCVNLISLKCSSC